MKRSAYWLDRRTLLIPLRPQPIDLYRYGTRHGRTTVSRQPVKAISLSDDSYASPGSPAHLAECPYGSAGERLELFERVVIISTVQVVRLHETKANGKKYDKLYGSDFAYSSNPYVWKIRAVGK